MTAPAHDDARLIDRFLDGTLAADVEPQLRQRLTEPAFADALARAVLLDDALRREWSVGDAPRREAVRLTRSTSAAGWSATIAALVAIVVLLWSGMPSSVASADELLARIAGRGRIGERAYRLSVVDRQTRDRSLDGAVLHLGARGQYVLRRSEPDGSETISGSDGVRGWIIPSRGVVRVSANSRRFRGLLPGEQFDLPFLDPAEGLDDLAKRYDLQVTPAAPANHRPWTVIEATRRDGVRHGPKFVHLEVDPSTLRIERMVLDRLPQAKEGPRSVAFDRLPLEPLGSAYFDHAAHHAPERPVVVEP